MRFFQEALDFPGNSFYLLRDLIKENIGIFYDDSKKDILADKLSPLALERNFSNFLDYYYYLKYDPEGKEEWDKIADALSVQETYFFREIDQIKALVDIIIPKISQEGIKHIKIWSSACATGEEPLSIAIMLKEKDWFEKMYIEIYGTDISNSAIEKAKIGIYKERSFRNFPKELINKYFTKEENGFRIIPEIHKRVIFRRANLVKEEEIKDLAKSKIIFCRNVFIYFSDDIIQKILRVFEENMENPGYLFVGSAESLLRFSHSFDLQIIGGAFVYVKR
ncbi:MAG: protein-glutamate O-methyltransferase CheR [Dictyoglomus sp.]|nr:protein-glutamate O-methyltransferase CheR [Dictyoglomus sp.]MDW8189201.1 protein-glutamate O-methyltransferase CheR [Dictyoglomus sp.]